MHLANLLIISGSGKNVGKTLLACQIIKHFSRNSTVIGLKISPHFHNNNKENNEAMDYDFFLRLSKKGIRGTPLNHTMATMRCVGVSHKRYFDLRREVKEVSVRHGGNKFIASTYYILFLLKYFLKKGFRK